MRLVQHTVWAHNTGCPQAPKERPDGGAARKGRRRDAALTWEVPPQLEPDFVKPAKADERKEGAPARPASDGDGRPVHPLVGIQRRAFESPAQQHLAAVVGQLLRAESVSVRALNFCTLLMSDDDRLLREIQLHEVEEEEILLVNTSFTSTVQLCPIERLLGGCIVQMDWTHTSFWPKLRANMIRPVHRAHRASRETCCVT